MRIHAIKFTSVCTGVHAMMLFAVMASCVSIAGAQDIDRYRPSLPINNKCVTILPAAPFTAIAGSTEILVAELKGVLILDSLELLQVPASGVDGLKIHPAADLTVAREDCFSQAIRPYLGQPVSIRSLNELAQNIVYVYRDCKRPAVDVQIPPGQEISGGVIQVVITESRVGAVKYRGNCHFDTCVLQQQNWLKSGDLIYEPCLHQELVWYNRNPFRSVGVHYEPGCQDGTTDIVYTVNDRDPVRYYMGYEDSGTRLTGLERLIFGVNFGNLLGTESQLSYQYSTDANPGVYAGVHSVLYQNPIFDNRDTVSLFGSWTDIDSSIAGTGVDATGWQISGRYHHTLCEEASQVDQFYFGFDTKGTDSDLDFGGQTVVGQQVEVVNFMTGFSSEQTFDDGYTNYSLDVFASPSNLLPNNRSRDFKQLRAGSRAAYVYARGNIERLYQVNCHSDFYVKLTGQIANDRLLQTEQLGFGGYNSIRGYDMRTLNGDNGYILNCEYRSRPFVSCSDGQQSSLTMLAFADVGQQFNWSSPASEHDNELLASAGVGLRYTLDQNCSIRFDYGIPLTDIAGVHDNSNGRIHLGAMLSY